MRPLETSSSSLSSSSLASSFTLSSAASIRSGISARALRAVTALALLLPLASPGRATAEPVATTQACLGDLRAFLTCPAGATVSGTECRQKEPRHGLGEGEHWSGSKRQGPALFLRGDDEDGLTPRSMVSFAATYKDHKKNGRIYRFDAQGRLESWNNVIHNEWYGLAVTCTPDGKVAHLATHFGDKTLGISRAWRSKDGQLSYAIEYDAAGKIARHLEATPELARRPDELCRPVRCDVNAAPDTSGLPAGVTLPPAP